MFTKQDLVPSVESTPTHTPVTNNVATFAGINDDTADVEWTEYFVPELFTPYSPSNPFFENPGFDEEVGEGKGKGRDMGGDDQGVCINNINVAMQPFQQGQFNNELILPFSFNNVVESPFAANKSCAAQHLAAQADRNTCSLSEVQPQMPLINPQGWNFDQVRSGV